MSWKAGGTQGTGRGTRAWGAGTLGGTWDHRGPILWELQPPGGTVLARNNSPGRDGEKWPGVCLADFYKDLLSATPSWRPADRGAWDRPLAAVSSPSLRAEQGRV